ncbi:hypothetical protein BO71DRAFT_44830 [Aspergillus ellipticus CBS 707.79]|uniref:Uncharacterized protein n=1 Tax=Aspergillus ellipticus CBS 707.79 TaxID=1448320 RepID=A0A319D2Y0_9EURO|nr:hypothetical protein BO71DRAFT_44830 [Aspergillus ellipticus CBS 707.79]
MGGENILGKKRKENINASEELDILIVHTHVRGCVFMSALVALETERFMTCWQEISRRYQSMRGAQFSPTGPTGTSGPGLSAAPAALWIPRGLLTRTAV